MIELLTGLITSGVYYLAQQHKDHLASEQAALAASKEAIRGSLEIRLKRVFSDVVKHFPKIAGLEDEKVEALKSLLIRGTDELEDELQRTISESLYGPFPSASASGDSRIDMFSAEGFEKALAALRRRKGMTSLEDATLSAAVPRLLTAMLRSLCEIPGVREIIRECRQARVEREIVGRLDWLRRYFDIDEDKTVRDAVCALREKLETQAVHQYNIKLAGRTPDIADPFRYMPPRMRRVVKENGRVPADYEKRTRPLDEAGFHGLVHERKRVFVLAGAGVGKTTFLYRLQLELLRRAAGESPVPVFENVAGFFGQSGTLLDRTSGMLKEMRVVDFSRRKADKVAGVLSENGRLCYLLDALDQCPADGRCKDHFQMRLPGLFGANRVVVTCRREHVDADPDEFRDIFSAFEWVILDGFDEADLGRYLGDGIVAWLGYKSLPKDFRALLTIPFYANVTRRLYLSPDPRAKRPKTRGDLLCGFEAELFKEARRRGVAIKPHEEARVRELLCRLSLDTLAAKQIQRFPRAFLDRYPGEYDHACGIIMDAHWVYMLFEAVDGNNCTFYHQLLQEFFAARRLEQLFQENRGQFDGALKELAFSEVVLDLLDDLLGHEEAFEHCRVRFDEALALADRRQKGIGGSGHKLTWLLALRDRKGEKSGLTERLQEIFDEEKAQSRKEAETDGKYVKIPAGPFLMGGYEFGNEQPVRVVYVPAFWISKYAETFASYAAFCSATGREVPDDRNWGREDRPVINVSWDDALEYAHWLGKAYHLPTEAQWEKAARGQLGRKYPWGNGDPEKSLCCFDLDWGTGRTEEVQAFPPQMYGLHQMAGNVWEWVEDDWHGSYEDAPEDGSAWVDKHKRGDDRVLRGGGWYIFARNCRSANRFRFSPGGRNVLVGFRLARSL